MGMEKLVLIIFAMIFVQGLFTFAQVKNYNRKIKEMKQYGMVGIGMRKGRLTPGNIVLLAVNKKGIVTRCESMKGISVFARFREVDGITGKKIGELKEEALLNLKYNRKGVAKKDPMLEAIKGIEERMAS